MMDFYAMIEQWKDSVARYCEANNIPSMDLKNLRKGVVYNYDLYTAYKNVEKAVTAYTNTPSSPVYAKELLACLKKWYDLISTSQKDKVSMRIMPNNRLINVFANVIGRIK